MTVRDDVPVKLRGNPDHPFTDGGLCRKVYPWLEYAADPGRLLTPLRRVAPKGQAGSIDEQRAGFEPISWDEALAEIASRFNQIIDEDGPAAIWPFSGTGNMGYLQGASTPVGDRLWNHLGVSGHDLSICSPAGHHGLSYSAGNSNSFDLEDIPLAGAVVIWGSNPLISGQHLWPFVEQAQQKGTPVVVVDPVRTRSAERADLHLPLRVGTDSALALGVCRALIDRGHADLSYLETNTVGFDEFAASVDEWTLERTAQVTGLSESQIEAFIDIVVRAPLAIKFGHGAQRHAGGGQTARAISCIPALLGSYQQRGGGIVYSSGNRYLLNTAKAGGRKAGSRPRQLVMTNLIANLEQLDPPVRALFIYGANPVVSNPDTTGVRRALRRPGLFTVVSELYLTPSTDFADIVLPSAMAHEHLDINNSFAHLYLNLNLPAVEPPGQALPQTEMFRRLATAMGLTEPSLFASDTELLDALLDTPELRAAGITAETLRTAGFARLPATEAPYVPFATEFPTPSGRFEFVSARAEADGHGRVPSFAPAAEVDGPPAAGRYDLVAAAGDWHINSTFAGTSKTLGRAPRPSVVIHPDDATRDGLSDGTSVRVVNSRGQFGATLKVDDLAAPGTAVSSKGRWDLDINATVEERDADMGQGAVYHDNRVTIEAV